ncbi:hypothetical protein O1611_g3942 [Lasiodiplodia mahajangana]|uniref:Uncharacterized protein n=1 Tax=Lasiodiplodia mahajangana TaxID=1108764 RepID=A0ACC2JQD1_9PEZI|nr:hypothetical protein O1611_g3942 [Lasiodiplodia mahajangana]
MAETRVPLGCVPGQHQELLTKGFGGRRYILAIIDCFKEWHVKRRYASRKLQAQDLIFGRQKSEAGTSNELHIEASLGIVVGHETRIQPLIVVLAGYGSGDGALGGAGSAFPNAAQAWYSGYSGFGGDASNYGNWGEYSGRGQDSGDQPPQDQDQPVSGSLTDELLFACPFYRHDAAGNQNCLHITLRRVGDVRQHIRRWHIQPSFCPRCTVTFQSDSRRDAHLGSCRANLNRSAPTGITPEQLRDMNNAAARRRNSNPEARWYEIWDILFPGEARPPSPYIDVASEWRSIGVRDAITRYLQNGWLSWFIVHRLNGLELGNTLELLLHDLDRVYARGLAYPGDGDDDGGDIDDDNDDGQA